MAEKFEAWGLVELMGHQRVAGRITEEVVGGANLLRVDIPIDTEKFRTAYYGSSAIYALHVTEEAVARGMCAKMDKRPPYAYVLEASQPALRPALTDVPSAHREYDDDGEPVF